MLKSKTAIVVVSILCLVIGGFLAFSYVSEAGRTVEVLVAIQDIPPFVPLRSEYVKTVHYPAVAVRKDALRTLDQAQGRMTRSVIPAGVPVLMSYLAGEGGSLARTLRESQHPGAFAMQFPANDAVAGKLGAGDKVDVLIGYKAETRVSAGKTETVQPRVERVEGLLVLDVLRPTEQQAAAGGGTVTVIFSADHPFAEKVMTARQSGNATLALRLLPAEGAQTKR